MARGFLSLALIASVGCTPELVPIERENIGSTGEQQVGITGWVCSPSGLAAIPGATVYVDIDDDGDGNADYRIETTSSSDGTFLLEDVPDGTHTVVIQIGGFTTEIEVTYESGTYEPLGGTCFDTTGQSIAVVSGLYDSIEELIDILGFEYTLYDGVSSDEYLGLITSESTLSQYDLVFLNCGLSDGWTSSQPTAVADALEAYVEQGGHLYASDWASFTIESAFPSRIDFYGEDNTGAERVGSAGGLEADVLDDHLIDVIGETAYIQYDLGAWVVIEGASTDSEVLITGDPNLSGVTLEDVPLAVRFNAGEGAALYTTFHNEAQASEDMLAILIHFILTL